MIFFLFFLENRIRHFMQIIFYFLGKVRNIIQNVVCWNIYPAGLTFTTLLANSADSTLVIFFLFFPGNRIWHFLQIVPIGQFAWNVKSCFLEKIGKHISKCRLLKILPRVLSVNPSPAEPCLYKQCRSRSVGFFRSHRSVANWSGFTLFVIFKVCEFVSTTWIG